jgi:hypothetical protein
VNKKIVIYGHRVISLKSIKRNCFKANFMLNFLTFFRFPKAPMRLLATFAARLAVNQLAIAEAALTTAALKSRREMIERTFREKIKNKRLKLFSSFD